MNQLLRHIVQQTYKPLLIKYLGSTRHYRYQNIQIRIPPEVFHPGFFTSTRFLLHFLSRINLAGSSFLELGAGSGLIAIAAAKRKAIVTATDINPVAVEYLYYNGQRNDTFLRIFQSDLFDNILPERFDIITINPPYYKKDPVLIKEYAWYCGKQGEYFQKLFLQLPRYMHPGTQAYMTVCDGADLEMIREFAEKSGMILTCVHSKQHLLQKNFIFQIQQQHDQ